MGDAFSFDKLGWVSIVGFVGALLMVIQQLCIMYMYDDRDGDSWDTAVKFYRRNIKWAVRGCVLFWIILGALLIFDYFTTPHRLLPGYRALFLNTKAPAILLLTAFFTGSIRLFVEHVGNAAFQSRRPSRADASFLHRCFSKILDVRLLWEMYYSFVDSEKLVDSDDEITLTDSRSQRRHDAWLWWFVLTTAFAFLGAVLWNTGSTASRVAADESLNSGLYLGIALGINTIAVIGYFSWVYVGLYTKLTEVHSFSDKMARYFIGSYTDKVTPRQVILIGPKEAGKTAFARCDDQPPEEEKGYGTRRLRLRMYTATDQRSSKQIARISAIDTPGENVGDHIMIAARFRADTLVLVLDVGKLNAKEALNADYYAQFELAYKIYGVQGRSPEGQYLRALWYATNRDPESLKASEVFKVRSFVLYLNHRGSREEQGLLKMLSEPGYMDLLAVKIGERFGVHPDDCCTIGGKAPLAAQARDILGYKEKEDRHALARWAALQDVQPADDEAEVEGMNGALPTDGDKESDDKEPDDKKNR